MSTKQGVTLSYVISLVGGLIVLIFSLVNLLYFGFGSSTSGNFGSFMRGAMDGYHNFMGNYASSTGFFTAVSVVSLVCGVIMVIAALVLRVHPQEHVMWGIVIVVFSAVSFVGMGGYFVGAAFGILGGALALTYKPIP
jgi:hypothetical protein